jgi:HSP90 family molecular chaperone
MSEYEWDDDDIETSNDSNAMKELRKAYKKLQAEKKELSEMLEGMQSSLRERSVKDVIASKGLPDKVAALIPKDATTSEEVEAWLAEYGDVFGVQAEANEPEQPRQVNPELAALNRISETQSSGQPFTNDPDQLASLISGAQNMEELNKLLFGSTSGPQAI